MNIKISELNKRISILSVQNIQDDYGFETEQEVEYCKCWSKMSNMSGTEIYKAGADYSKVITRFVIRYRKDKDITTDMKIRYKDKLKDKLYNITYVNNYNFSNEFVELVAEVIE